MIPSGTHTNYDISNHLIPPYATCMNAYELSNCHNILLIPNMINPVSSYLNLRLAESIYTLQKINTTQPRFPVLAGAFGNDLGIPNEVAKNHQFPQTPPPTPLGGPHHCRCGRSSARACDGPRSNQLDVAILPNSPFNPVVTVDPFSQSISYNKALYSNH